RRASLPSASACAPASAAPASSSAVCSWFPPCRLHFLDVLDLRREDVEHRLDAVVGERALLELLFSIRADGRALCRRRLDEACRPRNGVASRRRTTCCHSHPIGGTHAHLPSCQATRGLLQPRAHLLELRAQRAMLRGEHETDGVGLQIDPLRLRDDRAVEIFLLLADLFEERFLQWSAFACRFPTFGRARGL